MPDTIRRHGAPINQPSSISPTPTPTTTQALFYMTAFLTKALCEGKGSGLPPGWPLGYAHTIALILAYVAVARYDTTSGEWDDGSMPDPPTYIYTHTNILSSTQQPQQISSWRVHSGLHTPAQILVGAGVGATVGASWQELCTAQLNARVVGVLSRYPGSRVPLPYLAGVMVAGALTVGSVERKIARAMKRIVAKGNKGKGKGKKG